MCHIRVLLTSAFWRKHTVGHLCALIDRVARYNKDCLRGQMFMKFSVKSESQIKCGGSYLKKKIISVAHGCAIAQCAILSFPRSLQKNNKFNKNYFVVTPQITILAGGNVSGNTLYILCTCAFVRACVFVRARHFFLYMTSLCTQSWIYIWVLSKYILILILSKYTYMLCNFE